VALVEASLGAVVRQHVDGLRVADERRLGERRDVVAERSRQHRDRDGIGLFGAHLMDMESKYKQHGEQDRRVLDG
jgi:hypothetical protein